MHSYILSRFCVSLAKLMKENIFWYVLVLNGINVVGFSHKVIKITTCISNIVIFLTSIFLSSLGFTSILSQEDIKFSLAYILLHFFSVLTWYLLICRKMQIQKLLVQVRTHRENLHISDNTGALFITFILIAISIAPFIFVIIILFTIDATNDIKFWSYGYEIKDTTIRNFIITFAYFFYFIYYFYIPSLTTVIVCTIEYRCGEILNHFNRRLENLILTKVDTYETIFLMKKFFQILDTLYFMRSILSTPLFILLMCNFCGLFIILSNWNEVIKTNVALTMEYVVNSGSAILMITAQGFCASQIPDNLRKIKTTAERSINIYNSYFKNRKVLFYLKRLERIEPIYMTACGIVNFEKRFILNAFGVLLTYGLLITHLN